VLAIIGQGTITSPANDQRDLYVVRTIHLWVFAGKCLVWFWLIEVLWLIAQRIANRVAASEYPCQLRLFRHSGSAVRPTWA